MHLSLHADYSLRTLIYLGAYPDRLVATREIGDAYGISKNHLVRVVQTLGENGYIEIRPGRGGGIRLKAAPASIRLGEVVRRAEPTMRLVECFDPKTNTCGIVSACALKRMLREALDRFLEAMDRYTLADVLAAKGADKLVGIFEAATARANAVESDYVHP